MYKLFSRLFVALLLSLPWLLCAGCTEQQETRLTTTVRQAESSPPVEEPASELLLSQRAFIEVDLEDGLVTIPVQLPDDAVVVAEHQVVDLLGLGVAGKRRRRFSPDERQPFTGPYQLGADDDTGQEAIEFTEQHLPLTAREELDRTAAELVIDDPPALFYTGEPDHRR